MRPAFQREGKRSASRQDSFIQVRNVLFVALLALSLVGLLAAPVPTNKPSTYPPWWFSRGVIVPTNPTNSSPSWPSDYPASADYAVINEGQLKNFATQAYNELQASAPTNVWATTQGETLSGLVTSWSPTSGNDYLAINQGQLKTVAKPFYDVLTQIGYSSGYPWNGTGANDYAAANIGQLKNVFSFNVGLDSDSDGLPDWWEMKYLGHLGNDANLPSDGGTGPTLLQDYEQGIIPNYYFQGGQVVTPALTIVSGNNQTSASGYFAPLPLTVRVLNGSGSPYVNAPVTFTVVDGDGQVSTLLGSPAAILQLVTDGEGYAQAYFQQPSSANTTSDVNVTTGGQTVSFTEISANSTATPTVPLNGLTAWFKVDKGVIANNGSVTSIVDNASNYPLTQNTAGAQPTLVPNESNGEPGLRFNGNQSLGNSSRPNSDLNADMTIVTAGMTTNPAVQTYALYLGQNAAIGQNRAFCYAGGNEIFDGQYKYATGAAAPSAGAFVVEAATLDSALSNVAFYRNGVFVANSTITGLQNVSAGITMGAATPQAAGWQGDILEQLVYNRKLTSTELQQVGVYLADKYGLYNPNATWLQNAPYAAIASLITTNQWTKSQADTYLSAAGTNLPMTGLTAWFSADKGATVNINGNVTSIADNASNYSLTQSAGAAQPTFVSNDCNGEPGLRFNGSQSLGNSSRPNSDLNADMTIVTAGMTTNPAVQTYALYLGQNAAMGQNRAFCYAGGDEIFDGQYKYAIGAAAPPAGTFVVESATLDSTLSNVAFYQNGVSVANSTISGLQNVSSAITMGAATPGVVGWQGDILEQLVYNRKLTSTELQQVGVYLADKYGLYNPNATWLENAPYTAIATLITTNQWSKSQADAYLNATNASLPTTGMTAWFEADQGVTTDANGNISTWTDQSPSQGSATQTIASARPTLVTNVLNGKPMMRFNGSTSYLGISPGFANFSSGVTSFAVFTPTSTANYSRIFDLGNGPASDNILMARYGTQSTFGLVTFNGANGLWVPGGSESLLNTPQEYTMTQAGTSSVSIYQNGTQVGGTTTGIPALNNLTRSSNYIGKSNWSADSLYQGDMAEILIYNRPLTSTEQNNVEVYLANKYGLYHPNATWPQSAPYAAIASLITTNQWSKSQADAYLNASNTSVPTTGLAAWFKADQGVTADANGNISAWADQSPTEGTATQTDASAKPTLARNVLNGEPMVRFNGSSSYLSLPPGFSNFSSGVTSFAVFTPTTTANYSRIFDLGNGPASDNILMARYGTQSTFGLVTFNGANGLWVPGGSESLLNTPQEYTMTQAGTSSVSIYQNGTQVGGTTTGIPALNNLTRNSNYIGKSNWSSDSLYQGDMAEILIYDRPLTSTEQNSVEVYLANKYGLYHPNATWPQSSPYAAIASLITTNQWSKSQADAHLSTGLPMAWQIEYFGHTGVNASAVNGNGLTNLQSYQYGLDPLSTNTIDSNGISYAWEVQNYGAIRIDPYGDPTGSGYPNIYKYKHGTAASGTPSPDFVVDAAGTTNYKTIQSAIDATTQDYQIITVKPGTYTENPLIDNYKVLIRSTEGAASTIIQGQQSYGAQIYQDSIVDDFTFTGDSGCCLFAGENATARIVNCVLFGNQIAGAVLYASSAQIVATNCTSFGNNLNAGYETGTDGGGTISLINTILWDGTGDMNGAQTGVTASCSDIEGTSTYAGQGNINSNPLLWPDGHLGKGSPVIGAGTSTGAPDRDMDDEPRPYGGGYDIGADQYVDSQGTGIADWWQIKYFGDLIAASTVLPSGLTAEEAFQFQLNTTSTNTLDPNGISYSWENQYFGQINIDPNADPNGDGISNYQSYILGINPIAPPASSVDTDGDGVPDSLDYYPNDPTRWLNLPDDPTDHTAPTIELDVPSYATPVP